MGAAYAHPIRILPPDLAADQRSARHNFDNYRLLVRTRRTLDCWASVLRMHVTVSLAARYFLLQLY